MTFSGEPSKVSVEFIALTEVKDQNYLVQNAVHPLFTTYMSYRRFCFVVLLSFQASVVYSEVFPKSPKHLLDVRCTLEKVLQ